MVTVPRTTGDVTIATKVPPAAVAVAAVHLHRELGDPEADVGRVRLADRGEQIHQVLRLGADLLVRVVRREVRDAVNRARQQMGPAAVGGVRAMEDRISASIKRQSPRPDDVWPGGGRAP